MFCGDDPTRQVVDAAVRQPAHVRGRLHAGAVPGRPAGRRRPRHPRVPPVAVRRAVGRAEDRHRRRRRHRHRRPRPGPPRRRARPTSSSTDDRGATSRSRTIGPHAVPEPGGARRRAPPRAPRRRTCATTGSTASSAPRRAPASASCAPARPTSTSCRPSPISASARRPRRGRRPGAQAGDDLSRSWRRPSLEFAASVDEIVVIEEKRPFVETPAAQPSSTRPASPCRCVGKRDRSGQSLRLDRSASSTRRRWPRSSRGCLPDARTGRAVTARSHACCRCSRCRPGHRASAAAARTTARRSCPSGALVGGGVGCHGIMYFEARNAGMMRLPPTPMGAEGVPWIGLSPFVAEPHLIQNIGDGTLSHSGTLAIRASVAAGRRHHVQDPLQHRRRHDRRPGRHRPAWTCRR